MTVVPAGSLIPGMAALRSAAMSSSGRLAVAYGDDITGSRVTLWDVPSLRQLAEARIGQTPVAARFTLDETAVLAALRSAGDRGGQVVRWPVSDLQSSGDVLYRADDVAGIAMSRDARTVVFRSMRSGLRALDTTTGNAAAPAGSSPRYRKVMVPRRER